MIIVYDIIIMIIVSLCSLMLCQILVNQSRVKGEGEFELCREAFLWKLKNGKFCLCFDDSCGSQTLLKFLAFDDSQFVAAIVVLVGGVSFDPVEIHCMLFA